MKRLNQMINKETTKLYKMDPQKKEKLIIT